MQTPTALKLWRDEQIKHDIEHALVEYRAAIRQSIIDNLDNGFTKVTIYAIRGIPFERCLDIIQHELHSVEYKVSRSVEPASQQDPTGGTNGQYCVLAISWTKP
jgi:hypothetical protein